MDYESMTKEQLKEQLKKEVMKRKQAEQALKESEDRFNFILKKLPIVVFAQDKNLHYKWLYNPDSGLLYKGILDKFGAEIISLLNSTSLNKLKHQVLNSGNGQRQEIEVEGKGKTLYFDINIEPLADNDGNIIGITVMAMDISAYKKLEQTVREAEECYRHLVELSPDVIAVHSQQGELIFINKAGVELLGLKSKDEIIGKRVIDYVHPATREITRNKIQFMLNNQMPVPLFCQKLVRVDGAIIDVEATGTPLIFKGKKAIQVIMRDVGERKRFEEEMARLERFNIIGQMAAGLAHEIRNPMTTVRGFLQILMEKKECHPYKEYYDLMIEELDRANDIITRFLSISKSKSNCKVAKNLNEIIKTLYPMIQAEALKSEVTLKLELDDHIPDLQLDENEIRQLLLNLIRNGFEAMSPGKSLTIKTCFNDEDVVLSVQDEGSGIDSQILSKIGTPFFTTKDNGTGLGLAVIRSIAARHNAVDIIETRPEGTIISIRFKTD
ncbi:PAS domain S-box-containing protein [Desulfotomaculum arcticum]|uniref:histidine kinase n=1 Tax=Desulfotruncus arcticus DSM 17038 TaxID=1121424 RepID=A0A1I2Q109_9FIRM|nr:PAS domain S-box protein [Desulfotruncus arcticus]SFG21968.1 PAS domain S-box-containing protein [Desulfotomaculum arcticum] [Desulfotruncus arcticus DSM 17038]